MSLTVTNKASEVQFTRYNAVPPKKINMTVDGAGKEGKTHFSLTSPGPIAYHDFDFGLHGVADKFPDVELYHFPYEFSSTNRLPGASQEPLPDKAAKIWKDFVTNATASTQRCKTVVIDQGTRLWDLLRIARLGKLVQVPAIQYVNVNMEFDDFIQRIHRSPANIVWLHRIKPVYKNNEETDEMERAGYKGVGYDVDVVLLPKYTDKDGFTLTVSDCRVNRTIQGTVLKNEEISFLNVAMKMYPNTSEENWK